MLLVKFLGGGGAFEMGTALTWANVCAEKQATARIMDEGCMFASLMIKRRNSFGGDGFSFVLQ